MSFDSLLIHTCDIGSLAQGAQDNYGTPIETWPTSYEDEPCRFMSISGTEVRVGARVMISNWKLFLDDDVTIDEQDRVSDIKLRSDGTVVDASTFEVLLVQPRSNSVDKHHLEVFLQKVQ